LRFLFFYYFHPSLCWRFVFAEGNSSHKEIVFVLGGFLSPTSLPFCSFFTGLLCFLSLTLFTCSLGRPSRVCAFIPGFGCVNPFTCQDGWPLGPVSVDVLKRALLFSEFPTASTPDFWGAGPWWDCRTVPLLIPF